MTILNKQPDIRQSGLWAKYLAELGWQAVELKSGIFAYIKAIPCLGPAIKIPRLNLPIPFKEIDALAREQNAFFVKLEPAIETADPGADKITSLLKTNGFRQDRWALNPTTTIQIDLTRGEEELLAAMEKDTRYNIRLAPRRGVVVKETNELEVFKKLYYETAARKGFWVPKKELETLWRVFSKEGAVDILTAFYQDKPLAATLLLCGNRFGIYYHAASLNIHREVMAPYLLLWKAMLFLKKKDCSVFDLEGIYDPRIPSTKRWKGFTLFKKGFGGRELKYLGSFTKYYKLWAKLLFLPTRFF